MSQRLIIRPPGFNAYLETTGGVSVSPDTFPSYSADLSGAGQFVHAVFSIPATRLWASVNPVAGTVTSIAGAITGAKLAYNLDGFSSSARAYAWLFTARKKTGATANLVDNVARLYAGGVELGRITVTADTQKAGLAMFGAPEAAGSADARFALAADGSAITAGSITASGDAYSKTSHGLNTGDRVVLNSLTGGTGLTASEQYWFSKTSANAGLLCSSLENALLGTAVDVTLDASSVSLTKKNDLFVKLDSADANLEFHILALGTDA